MTRTAAIFASLLLGLPSLATAADTKGSAPDPKGTASEVARVMVSRESWSQGVQQIAQDTQARLQSHPGAKLQYPPDLGAKVRTEVEAVLPYDDLIGMHARELSSRYTEQELKDLLAFYRTPTGQKFIKVMPAATESVANQTQQRFQEKMPAVMQKLSKLATTPTASSKDKPKK